MSKNRNIIRRSVYGIEFLAVVFFIIILIKKNIFYYYIHLNFFSIFTGVLIGIIFFIVEKRLIDFFSTMKLEKTDSFDITNFLIFLKGNFNYVYIHLGTALLEELFWRSYLQTFLFKGTYLGIVLSVVFFTCSHISSFKNKIILWIDFIIFSVILGVIYFIYKDLFLVIGIHFIRNMMILFYREIYEKYS